MLVQLIGGGWRDDARDAVWGPFLEAGGRRPTVACVVLDEGDGPAQFARWETVLRATGACEPVPVLVPEGGRLDVAALADADALLVCGGLTPAYAAALAPAAAGVRDWLADHDRPYAGFSAGAAVAADRALVGGWREGGVPVCPEDASEDLDHVSVVDGLGLVPFGIDVHAGAWGTLGRAVAAVTAGHLDRVLAVDEDTAVTVVDGTATVVGRGAVWWVTRRPGRDGSDASGGTDRHDVGVVRLVTGERVPLDLS
ncbi:peptidase S51 [Aquipuribacter sp. SD81]|uniref:peptidase S51 n=1 Tax=Aquipuribacter sp. SD81 TaxID=3127703 RepID=UPI00301B2A63